MRALKCSKRKLLAGVEGGENLHLKRIFSYLFVCDKFGIFRNKKNDFSVLCRYSHHYCGGKKKVAAHYEVKFLGATVYNTHNTAYFFSMNVLLEF